MNNGNEITNDQWECLDRDRYRFYKNILFEHFKQIGLNAYMTEESVVLPKNDEQGTFGRVPGQPDGLP